MLKNRNALKHDDFASGSSDKNLIFHIQSSLDFMPKTYKEIANYIMEHPSEISSMSITQLANKIGTCSSTITRFCQFLGFSGFSQFKFNVEKSMLSIPRQMIFDHDESITAIKQNLLPRYLQCMEATVNQIKPSVLEHIAYIVTKADKICFFGHGGSGAIAQTGQILFMQIGLPAYSYTDISASAMAAAKLIRGDIAIGITSSGSAKTAVDALRVAKQMGATTIGITGFANSHIVDYSDILLCYNLGIEDVRLMHISRLCEIVVLGLLQNCILGKNYDTMSQDLQTAKDAFLGARYI